MTENERINRISVRGTHSSSADSHACANLEVQQLEKISLHAAMETVTHTLLIDSRSRDFRIHPTASSYTVRLPSILRDVLSASLVTAELPSSYPTISASMGNTTLSLTRNGAPLSVTLPDGAYSLTTLLPILRAALAPLDVDVSLLTGRCSFSSASDVLTVLPTGLAPLLGFSSLTTGTGSVTAPGIINLNPPCSLVLEIEELGSPAVLDPSTFSRNVFAKIPLNANSFDIVVYDKRLSEHTYPNPLAAVDKLRIRWRFPDGRAIDFMGLEHSLTLSVTCRRPGPVDTNQN